MKAGASDGGVARAKQQRAKATKESGERTKLGLVAAVVLVLASLLYGRSGSSTAQRAEVSPSGSVTLKQRRFTLEELATYNGADPTKPLLLSIMGEVFDVSSNPRIYGPKGDYNHFTGVDASRAYSSGCFKTHRTHDMRGMSTEEVDAIKHFRSFFRSHATYKLVGRVDLPDPEPDSPVPPPCDAKAEGGAM